MQVPATTQSRIQLCNMTIISLKLPQEFLQALEQMETCAIQMKNPVASSDWSLTARENLKPGSNQSRHETDLCMVASSIGNFLSQSRQSLNQAGCFTSYNS